LEQTFFDNLMHLFGDIAEWRHLPPASMVASFRGLAFRLLSRMGCAVQELLRGPHCRFPFKLFLLLEDESLADVVECASECELDTFSKVFIETFREQGLCHPDALMVLRTIALGWKMDISQIEARHASLRRLLKSAHQTKVMSASTLSAMWTCMRLSKRQSAAGVRGPQKRCFKVKPAPKRQKKRRARRSAWQAYVSEVAQGQRANFSEIAEGYKRLGPDELHRLQQKARLASSAGPTAGVRKRPFRDSLQTALVWADRRKRDAHWQRHRADLPDEDRLACMLDDVVASGAQGQDAVVAAGRESRLERAAIRSREQESAASLVRFREEQCVPAQQAWVSASGIGAEEAQAFKAFPFVGATALDFAPDSALVAQKALSLRQQQASGASLGTALALDWASRTATVTQGTVAPLPDPTAQEQRASRCRLAGICLCSPEGRVLARFGNAFLNPLRAQFRPATAARIDLKEGRIVVAMQASAPAGAAGGGAGLPPDFVAVQPGQRWAHIGLQYFSPFRPTMHVLRRSGMQPLVVDGVSLLASGDFVSLFPFLCDLDLSQAWWLQFFKTWESDQPLGTLIPSEVCVRAMGSATMFWPGRGRRPRGQPGQPQPPGGGEGGAFEIPIEELDFEDPGWHGGDDDDGGEDLWGPLPEASLDEELLEEDNNELLSELMEALLHRPPQPPGEVPTESPAAPPGLEQASEDGADLLLTAHLPAPMEGSFGGMAASSTDAPPGPQPLAPSDSFDYFGLDSMGAAPASLGPVAVRDGPRQKGVAPTPFHGGNITFYPDNTGLGKGRFQATCGNGAEHGTKCRLTRTAAGAARLTGSTAQGRPLGLLAAWLQCAQMAHTKEEHEAITVFLTHDEREQARSDLMLEENGPPLATHEREKRPSESDEPMGWA
jgi:hypothetical protein